MPATPDDLKDALDRLTKALEAQAARKEKDDQKREQKAEERKRTQEERKRQQDQARREKDQAARDAKLERLRQKDANGGPTFDPSTPLGKLEQAYGKYKDFKEGYRDLKAGGDPFKFLGRLMGGGGGGGEGAAAEGGAAEGAGGAAGGAAGAAGAAAAAVLVVYEYAKALIKFRNHVDKATDALVDMQRQLASASPSMAAVMARRDVQELFRDRRKGEALASSAEYLTGAEQRRKDAEAPLSVLFTAFQNRVYGFGNDIVGGMAKQLNALLGLSEDFEKGQDVGLAGDLKKVDDAFRKRLEDERTKLDKVKQAADAKRGRVF